MHKLSRKRLTSIISTDIYEPWKTVPFIFDSRLEVALPQIKHLTTNMTECILHQIMATP